MAKMYVFEREKVLEEAEKLPDAKAKEKYYTEVRDEYIKRGGTDSAFLDFVSAQIEEQQERGVFGKLRRVFQITYNEQEFKKAEIDAMHEQIERMPEGESLELGQTIHLKAGFQIVGVVYNLESKEKIILLQQVTKRFKNIIGVN